MVNLLKLTIAMIVAHLAVATLHGVAHLILKVGLSQPQILFVFVVITAAPLAAGFLILKMHTRAGARLLSLSMLASMIFGVWNHYLVMSPDHVSQVAALPDRFWGEMFVWTSHLLALTEASGVVLAGRILNTRPR